MSEFSPTYPALVLRGNEAGRDFVCGDLHGNMAQLESSLEEVGFDRTCDRLFALGDLVDRGDDCLAVLRLLDEPWFFSLLGNHDEAILQVLSGDLNIWRWYSWGGQWHRDLTPEELMELERRCRDHVVDLPLSITLDYDAFRIGLVHAEAPDDWERVTIAVRPEDPRLWGRDRLQWEKKTPVRNIDLVYVGHSVTGKVRQLGNVVYLDTGAGHEGGWLTLLEIKKDATERLDTTD